jgi:hypothetical protein
MTETATLCCPHCEKPLRASLTRCPGCGGVAHEPAAAQARVERAPTGWPELDRPRGYPVIDSPPTATRRPTATWRPAPAPAGATGDIAALARHALALLERGGLTALLATLIAAPVAVLLAGAGSILAMSFGLLPGIAGTFICVFSAVALAIAGPLSAFLIAVTGERPTLGRTLELAASRVPTLAWLLAALSFSQIAVALPFQLIGGAVHLPGVGLVLGAAAAFLLGARFGMLGIAISVVENAPIGKTIERVVEVGRGRLPLLLVAAGVPKLVQALPGALAAAGAVSVLGATSEIAYGNVAFLAALLVAGLLLEVGLAAATLCVLDERPAVAGR